MNPDHPLLLTPRRAAGVLGTTIGQLRGLVRAGALPAQKIGQRLYIRRTDLHTFAAGPSVTIQAPTMPRAMRPARLARHG